MSKRILIVLTLVGAMTGAIAACNAPAGTTSPTILPTTPVESMSPDLPSESPSDAFPSESPSESPVGS